MLKDVCLVSALVLKKHLKTFKSVKSMPVILLSGLSGDIFYWHYFQWGCITVLQHFSLILVKVRHFLYFSNSRTITCALEYPLTSTDGYDLSFHSIYCLFKGHFYVELKCFSGLFSTKSPIILSDLFILFFVKLSYLIISSNIFLF